jgi:hypothetical protein
MFNWPVISSGEPATLLKQTETAAVIRCVRTATHRVVSISTCIALRCMGTALMRPAVGAFITGSVIIEERSFVGLSSGIML